MPLTGAGPEWLTFDCYGTLIQWDEGLLDAVTKILAGLKAAGFSLCIISNTDDDIIAGNLAQLGGHIDRVISAEQAGAYNTKEAWQGNFLARGPTIQPVMTPAAKIGLPEQVKPRFTV